MLSLMQQGKKVVVIVAESTKTKLKKGNSKNSKN